MNLDWTNIISGIIVGILGGGGISYLFLDKKVRSNGEKAEDSKKELDFSQALDKWQTDKLKEIINDYDNLKKALEESEKEKEEYRKIIIEKNKEIAELRSKSISVETENKELRAKNIELQEQIIAKNEEIIKARRETSNCAKYSEGCMLFTPENKDEQE